MARKNETTETKLSAEQVQAIIAKLMAGGVDLGAVLNATPVQTAQVPVDTGFITQVKAARAQYVTAAAVAKANGEKAPAKPKAFASGDMSVSLMSGWITTKHGFNGSLQDAETLLASLPAYIAALKANAQYAELMRFIASTK